LANGDNRGLFNVRYERIPEFLLPDFLRFLNYNTTMTVLDTDYDNFAVMWTCRNLNQYTHAESSWLMTRDQQPTEEVLQTAYGVLDRFGLRNFFVKSDQTRCDL
jgi:Lipocalin / cytosolic fatty-acid binding protein family